MTNLVNFEICPICRKRSLRRFTAFWRCVSCCRKMDAKMLITS